MVPMASQITNLTIVYSTVYSGRSRKTSKLRVIGLCEGNLPVIGQFPAQRASNAENVSIWWRHHKNIVCEKAAVLSREGEFSITDTFFSKSNASFIINIKSPPYHCIYLLSICSLVLRLKTSMKAAVDTHAAFRVPRYCELFCNPTP